MVLAKFSANGCDVILPVVRRDASDAQVAELSDSANTFNEFAWSEKNGVLDIGQDGSIVRDLKRGHGKGANHLEGAHGVADIDTSFGALVVCHHGGSLSDDIIEVARVIVVIELGLLRYEINIGVTLAVLDTAVITQVDVIAVIDKVEERRRSV